jgi:hypothetical protein
VLTPTLEAIHKELRETTSHLLVRRVRTGVWLALAATVLWALDDLVMHRAAVRPLYWVALVQAGLSVTELTPQRMSLEEYFLAQGGAG